MSTLEEKKHLLQSLSAADRDCLYREFCTPILAAADVDNVVALPEHRRKLRQLGDLFEFTSEHRAALLSQTAARRRDIITLIETIVPA